MGQIDKRSITLSADVAEAIDSAVKAGEYASDDEATAGALREWKERRDNHGYTIAELRRLIQEGIDSGVSQEDGRDFLQRMRKKYQDMADKAQIG